ncbi:DUF111 family protein [Lacticaseibacillus rhamnosus]
MWVRRMFPRRCRATVGRTHSACSRSPAASVPAIRELIRHTTGSLGVRVTNAERWPAARSVDSVWVEGHLVRGKISARRIKAEHAGDDRRQLMSLQPLSQCPDPRNPILICKELRGETIKPRTGCLVYPPDEISGCAARISRHAEYVFQERLWKI